jgi:hypothetical protein
MITYKINPLPPTAQEDDDFSDFESNPRIVHFLNINHEINCTPTLYRSSSEFAHRTSDKTGRAIPLGREGRWSLRISPGIKEISVINPNPLELRSTPAPFPWINPPVLDCTRVNSNSTE